jgi:hypothetical protein
MLNDKEIIEQICEIFWKYDPVGLSTFGICTPLEYDVEAKMLIKYLNSEKLITVEKLSSKIVKIFIEMFSKRSVKFEKNSEKRIAEEIIEKILSEQAKER